nr:hypothetical protein [Tanacetum cinerariifolium]
PSYTSIKACAVLKKGRPKIRGTRGSATKSRMTKSAGKVLRWTVMIDSSLVWLTVLIEIVAFKTILDVILLSRLMKSRRTCLIRKVLTILNETPDCCGLKLLDVIVKYEKIISALSEWILIIAMI